MNRLTLLLLFTGVVGWTQNTPIQNDSTEVALDEVVLIAKTKKIL
jgi:hypothetical protein